MLQPAPPSNTLEKNLTRKQSDKINIKFINYSWIHLVYSLNANAIYIFFSTEYMKILPFTYEKQKETNLKLRFDHYKLHFSYITLHKMYVYTGIGERIKKSHKTCITYKLEHSGKQSWKVNKIQKLF